MKTKIKTIKYQKEIIETLNDKFNNISIPIPKDKITFLGMYKDKVFIELHSDLQINDYFFVQEDFLRVRNESTHDIQYRYTEDTGYPSDVDYFWIDSTEMKYEESRFKGKIIDVEIDYSKLVFIYDLEII